MILLHKSFCIWKFYFHIFALFDHDCVVRSLIAHVQILFNHDGLLWITLFRQRGASLFRKLLQTNFSGRCRRIPIFFESAGIVFGNGVHLLRRFLLFYHGIRHGQSVRREDAAIAMDVHFGNPQRSRHGTCMLWTSASKASQRVFGDVEPAHLREIPDRSTHRLVGNLHKAICQLFYGSPLRFFVLFRKRPKCRPGPFQIQRFVLVGSKYVGKMVGNHPTEHDVSIRNR
mmetsp:Transcript_29849/g.63379  ORF Transcript_29849/g.63379 Transcript_29849/m.63379 type:complete len:229 (-) Transcript_29849:1464-2150(-)